MSYGNSVSRTGGERQGILEKDREQGYNEQDNSPAERYCCTSVHRNRETGTLEI